MENEAASLFRKPSAPTTPETRSGRSIPTRSTPPSQPQAGLTAGQPTHVQRPLIGWALVALMGVLLVLIVWYGLTRHDHDSKSAPSASTPAKKPRLSEQELRAAEDALAAVKAMESVTSVGVIYADYLRRLGDAKIAVDAASARISDPELRLSIALVMTRYSSVGDAWGDKVQSGQNFDPGDYLRIMAQHGCQSAQDVLTQADREPYPGMARGVLGIPAMMSCAADQVTALQGLVQSRKHK
jgi:hypothetical protein